MAVSSVASTSGRRVGLIVEPSIQYTSSGKAMNTVVVGGGVVVVVVAVVWESILRWGISSQAGETHGNGTVTIFSMLIALDRDDDDTSVLGASVALYPSQSSWTHRVLSMDGNGLHGPYNRSFKVRSGSISSSTFLVQKPIINVNRLESCGDFDGSGSSGGVSSDSNWINVLDNDSLVVAIDALDVVALSSELLLLQLLGPTHGNTPCNKFPGNIINELLMG